MRDRFSVTRSANLGWLIGLVLIGLCLGITVAILPENSVFVLLGPLALLIIMIFWVMPSPRTVPITVAWYLVFSVVAIADIWPTYIALRLPGLPWLNMPRVLMSIFLTLWLYCILNSPRMRAKLADDMQKERVGFLFLTGLIAVMIASILVSIDKAESTTKVTNYILMSVLSFFAIASLADRPKRLKLLALTIPVCALFEMIIGLREARLERPFWVDFVPPGFSYDEQFVAGLLEGVYREDEYRVQGHFFVSLSYAEFMAISLPFAIHWVVESRNWIVKAFFVGVYLLSFPAIYVSHSRLGMVGFFLGSLVYGGFYALRSWRRSPRSVFAPILVLLFPLLLIGFLLALSVSNRLQNAMIGGGETQASDDARALQNKLAIPKILESPIVGHGVAVGGAAVGYASENGHETFDNGILLVGLETGVTGLICFLGFIGWVIVSAGRLYFLGRTDISKLAGAICVSFIVFLFTRWVLAQQENNQLIMVIAGMLVCIQRIERHHDRDENRYAERISSAHIVAQ